MGPPNYVGVSEKKKKVQVLVWSNLGLLRCRRILYCLSHGGSPCEQKGKAFPVHWFWNCSGGSSLKVLKSLKYFCFILFGERVCGVGREACLEHSNKLSSPLFQSFLGLIVMYFPVFILSHVSIIWNCGVLFWSYHISPLIDHTFLEILEILKQRKMSRELYNRHFYASLMWFFNLNLIKVK